MQRIRNPWMDERVNEWKWGDHGSVDVERRKLVEREYWNGSSVVGVEEAGDYCCYAQPVKLWWDEGYTTNWYRKTKPRRNHGDNNIRKPLDWMCDYLHVYAMLVYLLPGINLWTLCNELPKWLRGTELNGKRISKFHQRGNYVNAKDWNKKQGRPKFGCTRVGYSTLYFFD